MTPEEVAALLAASAPAPVRRPRGETARLRALARYAVLDTPADDTFDDAADLARVVTGRPVAGIGFLDQERIWFKSRLGLVPRQLSRAQWPGEASVPPVAGGAGDARMRVRCHQETFQVGGEVFRFLAAAPLITTDGYLLGELFVMDDKPGDLGPRERAALTALARQVMSELELRRTALSYHAVIDGAGHVVFQLDGWCRLVSLTPTWSGLTGYGVVRSLGRQLQDFVHHDDRRGVALHLADMSAGTAPSTFECRILRLADDDVPVEVIARPLTDESGRRLGLVGVLADVSARKAQESEARHTQELETFGRLSADLAREIDAPVQRVEQNARLIAESHQAMTRVLATYREVLGGLPGDGPTRAGRESVERVERETGAERIAAKVPAALEETLEGVERVTTLLRAMQRFNTAGIEAQESADLEEVLRAAVRATRERVGGSVEVVANLGELPPVTCCVNDLGHVFLELLVNAADAVEEKGGPGTVTLTSVTDGDEVVVSVSDTGTGVPPGLRQRIFEPFFSTRRAGTRAGQGLTLARVVVEEKHGGSISVSSEVGAGSTFTVRLPVAGRRSVPAQR